MMVSRIWKYFLLLILLVVTGVLVFWTPPGAQAEPTQDEPIPQEGLRPIAILLPEHSDVSPPLSSIPYTLDPPGEDVFVAPDLTPRLPHYELPFALDPVVQNFFGTDAIPSPTITFEGINNLCSCLPPDPNGDVGPNHIVEMVNAHFAVYDKTGSTLLGPAPINAIWAGFGGPCQVDNSGDPIVVYDHIADRWVLTQFAVTTGSHECFAVSTTPDPTGTYYRYAYNIGGFPDYPKVGVWVDSYLATYRNFGAAFDMQAAAYNRAKMLVGDPSAESVLFSMSAAFVPLGIDGFLPADLDGPAPPAGTDAPFAGLLPDENGYPSDAIGMFHLDVDWSNPGAAVLLGPDIIPVAPFDHDMCNGDRNCIPQPGTSQGLDAIADRLLHRLAYRYWGDYESIVALHTVNAGTVQNELAGERWYELRDAGNGWGVYQQGTYAPDSEHRWMGSIAQDGQGNIAMAYSVSSSSVFPSLRYTGRLVTDPLGVMAQGEDVIIAGSGSQTHTAARWGDYSSISVDPEDDCTFWAVNEYIQTTGSAPWQTRIGAFTFPDCLNPTVSDFGIWAQPPSLDVCVPNGASFNVSVFEILNPMSVTLSATGVPAGYNASFTTNPVVSPGSSVMNLTNTGAATAGAYPISVVGIAPTATHTTTVSLNLYDAVPATPALVSPADGALGQSLSPVLTWSAVPFAQDYLVEVATDAGFTSIVDSATVVGTSYQVSITLNSLTTYYWRVTPGNVCGDGSASAAWSFTTIDASGACPAGLSPTYTYYEFFEGGEAGWTHGAFTNADTWTLTASNPSPGSGGNAFFAVDTGSPSDQWLMSPSLVLPTGQTQLTLQFYNEQNFEDPAGSGGCWDGGFLEYTTDAGSNWTQIAALNDPYDGIGDNGPPAGVNLWCGETGGVQPWLNAVVSLDSLAGQTIQFRWRLVTDAAAGAEGWYIDDVNVQYCQAPTDVALTDFGESPPMYVWYVLAGALLLVGGAYVLRRRRV